MIIVLLGLAVLIKWGWALGVFLTLALFIALGIDQFVRHQRTKRRAHEEPFNDSNKRGR